MSIEGSRAVLEKYFEGGHDTGQVMADDVIFTLMGTGEESKGWEAIQQMLVNLYSVAFEAIAEITNIIYGDSGASAEFDFIGVHTGDFAGVPATGISVKVPMCVNYDIAEGKIQHAHVYFETPVLLKQSGVQS